MRSTQDPPRYRIQSNRCRDRWCEACAVEQRRVVARNLRSLLPQTRLRLVTLTLKTTATPLAAQLDKMHRCFAKFRKHPKIRRCLTGGLAFIEITLNPTTKLWHPHIHCLCEGRYVAQTLARQIWHNITGDSYIVDVRAIGNPDTAAGHFTKYAGKAINHTVWRDPKHYAEAICAMHGRRTYNAFGTWRKFSLARNPETELEWQYVGPLWKLIQNARSGSTDDRQILNLLRTEVPADEVQTNNRDPTPSLLPGLFD